MEQPNFMYVAGKNISEDWRKAVATGKFLNILDDALNQRKIRFGLQLQPESGKIEYFAEDANTGDSIVVETIEKLVGSKYCVQYNGYRKLRPGSAPLQPGRQPDIPAGIKECRFYCQDPSHQLSVLRREKLVEVNLKTFAGVLTITLHR